MTTNHEITGSTPVRGSKYLLWYVAILGTIWYNINMITEHWTNHILHTNINDGEYINQLHDHISCTIPFGCGYRSPEEYLLHEFYKDDPEFDLFKQYIKENIDEYIKQVYHLDNLPYHIRAFLLTNGIYTKTSFHNHRGAFLSGVFYVNVDEYSGDLIFHDPRFNAVRSTPLECAKAFEPIIVQPKNGDVVVFPSFVYHETNISFSDVPRILIPFDVYISSD